MPKVIIVKKNRYHRYLFRFVAVIILCVMLVSLVVPSDNRFLVAMVFPISVPSLLTWVYYEMWELYFFKDKIKKRSFLRKTQCFLYSQIESISLKYSYTNHGYVNIVFLDGRNLTFQLKDDHARQGIKVLRAHHSINSYDGE